MEVTNDQPFFESDDSYVEGPSTRRDSVLQPIDHYVYTPLDDYGRQVRICDILPGDGPELAIELRIVDLADNTRLFVCLSYVWGEESVPAFILVNGRRHKIRQNLYTLLYRLRALGLGSAIWIDAVCIDQSDTTEKAEQVKLMGHIYSEAKGVLIGLDEKAAVERNLGGNHMRVKEGIESLAAGSHLVDVECLAAPDSAGQALLLRLLRSPWLTRTWTVQEVYCHMQSIAFTIENLRRKQHILQPMILFQHLAVSDVRDKVYAFHGLHTKPGTLPVPDYETDHVTVFVEFALWLLKDTHSLMALALDLTDDSDGSLPSWVPNFGAKLSLEPNYWRTRLDAYKTYSCAQGIEWSLNDASPGTLRLRGVKIGMVEQVTADFFDLRPAPTHAELLRDWHDFACGGHSRSTSEQALNDTFVETMIAGCIQDDDSGVRRARSMDLADWRAVLTRFMKEASFAEDARSSTLMYSHVAAVLDRRLFITGGGCLGVGPKTVREGDSVWSLAGGRVPFVLRKKSLDPSAEQENTLLGHAYVHGVMRGEALHLSPLIEDCVLV